MELEIKSTDTTDIVEVKNDIAELNHRAYMPKTSQISSPNDADSLINDAFTSDVRIKAASNEGAMLSASNGICKSLDRSFDAVVKTIFQDPTHSPNRRISRQRKSYADQKVSTIVSQDWLAEFSITSLPYSTQRPSSFDDGVTIEDLAQNPFVNYFPRPDPPRFEAVEIVKHKNLDLPSAEELELAALIVGEGDSVDFEAATNGVAYRSQVNGNGDTNQDGPPVAKKTRPATATKSRPNPTDSFFDIDDYNEDLSNFYDQSTDVFCEPSSSNILPATLRRKKMKSLNLTKKLKSDSPAFSFSFETPPTTPSEGDGHWQPSIYIEAFRNGGSGIGPAPEQRLELGHNPGPPALFSCRSCRNFDPATKLNNLSKHIETKHCPDLLICLLCKSDEKGRCPHFETANAALFHAMEHHNSNDHRYFLCDVCQVLVYSPQVLVAHMRRYHCIDPTEDSISKMRRFPCLLCLFPFKHSGHRVDHFRANHQIDIKAFYTRNAKKGPASKCGNGRGMQMPSPSPKLTQKESFDQKRSKVEKKTEDTGGDVQVETKLIRIKKCDEEASESSSNVDTKNNRRIVLRPDLKDKYADILMNQPRVVVPDVMEEYFQGRYDYYSWKFFQRHLEKPKIRLNKR